MEIAIFDVVNSKNQIIRITPDEKTQGITLEGLLPGKTFFNKEQTDYLIKTIEDLRYLDSDKAKS